MTAISVSERLLEMAAFYTPLALTVTERQHIGELLGRLFYIISTLPKGIILGAVQSNPCLSALHPGNGDIGINRSSVPLNRP